MKQHEAERLAERLGSSLGMQFSATLDVASNGSEVTLSPVTIHKNLGFTISIKQGWKRLSLDFTPSTFAKDLIRSMEACTEEDRSLFSSIVGTIADEGGNFIMNVNGKEQDSTNPESWSSSWETVKITLKTKPLDVNAGAEVQIFKTIQKWTELYTASILALVPVEDIENNIYDDVDLPDGALKRVTVNRYERKRVNRTICLHHHGARCKVCNFSFLDEYGEIGYGFIHVHHTVPVSQMGKDYKFDPVNDLVPVCPNCHSMLHRRNPPYSVEELKRIISDNNENRQ